MHDTRLTAEVDFQIGDVATRDEMQCACRTYREYTYVHICLPFITFHVFQIYQKKSC